MGTSSVVDVVSATGAVVGRTDSGFDSSTTISGAVVAIFAYKSNDKSRKATTKDRKMSARVNPSQFAANIARPPRSRHLP